MQKEIQWRCIKDKRKMAMQDGVIKMPHFVDHPAVAALNLAWLFVIFLWNGHNYNVKKSWKKKKKTLVESNPVVFAVSLLHPKQAAHLFPKACVNKAQIIFPYGSFNCLTKVASHVKENTHSPLILRSQFHIRGTLVWISCLSIYSKKHLNLTMQRWSFHTIKPLRTALYCHNRMVHSVPTITAHIRSLHLQYIRGLSSFKEVIYSLNLGSPC